MQPVTVIGGGFSGLAACLELERRGIAYLLIEVKRRTGGSLNSVQQGDFVFDEGAAASLDTLPTDFLTSLGLADQTFHVGAGVIALRGGMGQLTAAMTARLTQPRMMRTAVSSLGEIDGAAWGICLENGVLLTSQRVIIAAPARYAARMVRNPLPQMALQLDNYLYDEMVRVSLAYRTADLPATLRFYRHPSYVYHLVFDQPPRVPLGWTQFHIGLRLNPQRMMPDDLIASLTDSAGLPASATATHVAYWSEADALSVYDDDHAERMNAMMALLPPTIALIGSDYVHAASPYGGIVRLEERLMQAQSAVERVLNG